MSLTERANSNLRMRQQWFKEAVDTVLKVRELPDEIKELSGNVDCTGDTLYITLYGGSATQLICECNGVIFGKPEFSSHDGTFSVEGKLNGIHITVREVDKPPDCVITKKRYMATKYTSSCDQANNKG